MALESLAPDQRAVVELILRQDRSYEELAGLLEISAEAVRRRARAGVAALGAGGELGEEERGRVVDYLLGQLDGPERAAAVELLSRSSLARAWAQEIAEKLRPVARRDLPELPAARPAEASRPGAKSSSRLGGAILIALCTVLVVSLAVWLVTRDDGKGSEADSATAAGSTAAAPTATPRSLAEIALRGVGGSKAKGLMQVNVTQAGEVGIVVLAQDVEPSQAGEAYAVWLTDARRAALRIGFENKDSAGRGAQDGTLALSGPSSDVNRARFTRALTQYDHLEVSLETSDKGTAPASVALRGSLQRLQGGS